MLPTFAKRSRRQSDRRGRRHLPSFLWGEPQFLDTSSDCVVGHTAARPRCSSTSFAHVLSLDVAPVCLVVVMTHGPYVHWASVNGTAFRAEEIARQTRNEAFIPSHLRPSPKVVAASILDNTGHDPLYRLKTQAQRAQRDLPRP